MKRNQNSLFILAGVIALGLGLYYFNSNKPDTVLHDNNSGETKVSVVIPAQTSISTTASQNTNSSSSAISPPTTTAVLPTDGAKIISYNNSSFSTKSLSTSIGDTVKFENKSATQISIFSTPYPDNTDYLLLNIGIIGTGQKSTGLKFDKKGTYQYYEKSSPNTIYKIVVE